MKYKLLSNRWKKPGWLLFSSALVAGIFVSATGFESSWLQAKAFTILDAEPFGKSSWLQIVETNFTNTLIGVSFITGGMLIAFSKEKQEDEFIGKLRLSALLWAVCINYALLLAAFIFVQGLAFLTVMVYNMFTVLLLFIARFSYLLYITNKTTLVEKYD